MNNFVVPNTFVPGTKAKAQEVNENFVSIQDELNQKAEKAGSISQVFNVANAQDSSHAVNKGQFETAISDLSESFNNSISRMSTPFLIERAHTDSSGNPDFIVPQGGILTFKVNDSNYGPIVAVPANNLPKFTITSLSNLNLSTVSDGTYNIFVNKNGVVYGYKNTIYWQKSTPSNPIANDIFVNISSFPLSVKIYLNSYWVDFDDVYLGSVLVSNRSVTSVKHAKLNDNGVNVNRANQSVVETTYKNGTSWYRIWSDGWIEQGGKTGTGTNQTVTFLKLFKDTNYCLLTVQYYVGSSNGDYATIKDKTITGFTIPGYSTMSYGWYACGY